MYVVVVMVDSSGASLRRGQLPGPERLRPIFKLRISKFGV